MKIIHFSDIHFSSTINNHLLNKKIKLIEALKSEVIEEDFLLIIIAGDIANFGIEKEYNEIASPFFNEIQQELQKINSAIKIEFLFIPGNHDCDFSNKEELELRDILIERVNSNLNGVNNSAILNQIIVQNAFNIFIDKYHSRWNRLKLKFKNEFLFVVEYQGTFQNLDFIGLNTAWISTINEKPGHMKFPNQELENALRYIGNPSICMLHHPLHWLEPNNRREIADIIFNNFNLVLTGHEHISNTQTVITENNRHTIFIEGASLQDLYNEQDSQFNILRFNKDQNIVKVKYKFCEGIYRIIEESTEFDINKAKGRKSKKILELNENFKQYLNELSIPISHPRTKDITLNELFMYPDLEEYIYQDKSQDLVEGIQIPDLISNDKESILIIGGEKDSGKSTIIKILFQVKLGEGYFPLVIGGESVNPDASHNIIRLIEKSHQNCYEDSSQDLYVQLRREQRILMIDDWHLCNLNDGAKQRFFTNALKYFTQIIIFSDSDIPVSPTFLMNIKETGCPIRRFKILEFGHQKREDLISKWVQLGQEDIITEEGLIKTTEKFKRAMEPILKNGFVPRYPIYILAILNSLETREAHNLDKSSNGYYFEILIKDSLVNLEVEFNETEKVYQYLTDFSYKLLSKYRNKMNLEDWKEFHENHLEYYDMEDYQLPFEKIKSKLINEKVIRLKDSCYEFYYPYVFYFFVAQYYARNISSEKIQAEILELTDNIHITQNANILMFLTHLSKHPYIIECVVASSQYLLEGVEPSKLEDDITYLNKLCMEIIIPKVEEDLNIVEERKKNNHNLDELEKREANQIEMLEELDEDALKSVNTANKAFKMLEVIGQILRNYYGSLSKKDKQALVETHYDLGLRMNHWLIGQIEEVSDSLIIHITNHLNKRNSVTPEAAEKYAMQFIHVLASLITHNNLWKIANTIGTEDLSRTYKRIEENNATAANQLINLIIKIEYYAEFPYKEIEDFHKLYKQNNIVMRILREVIKRYIYLNHLSPAVVQKICRISGLQLSKKNLVLTYKK